MFLSPLLSSFSLQHVIRIVQENQTGLKMNGKYQIQVFATDVNLLGANIHTMKKNINQIDIGIGLSYIKNNFLS
jgi:hypothetical protein